MLKLVFRSSILLTALLSTQGLQASYNGFMGEKPIEHEEHSVTLQSSVLVPAGLTMQEYPVLNLQKDSPLMKLPRDLWAKILYMSDPASVVATSESCTLLRSHVVTARQQALNSWLRVRNPVTLSRQMFHPALVVRLHEEVARQAPLFTIDHSVPPLPRPALELTPVVDEYLEAVTKSPYLSRLLGQLTLSLDPARDCQMVCLMACILNDSPDAVKALHTVQNEFRPILAEIKTFLQLQKYVNIPENLERLRRCLMTLKLLSLYDNNAMVAKHILDESLSKKTNFLERLNVAAENNKNELAHKLIENITLRYGELIEGGRQLKGQYINAKQKVFHTKALLAKADLDYFSILFIEHIDGVSSLTIYLKKYPQQPLWVCYTDMVYALKMYENALDDIDDGFSSTSPLQNAASFGAYLQALFPEDTTLQSEIIWNCAATYAEQQGNIQDQTKYLNNIIGTANAGNPARIGNAEEALVDEALISARLSNDEQVWKQYGHILGLMEESLKTFAPGSSERCYMLYKIAQMIVTYNDSDRFEQVIPYLDEVLNRYGPDEEEVEFSVTDPDGYASSNDVSKAQIDSLKCALFIYQGRFDEALQLLNVKRSSAEKFDFINADTLLALRTQMHNPNLPPKLIKKSGDIMSQMTKYVYLFNLFTKSSITKNKGMMAILTLLFDEEFINLFFKNHPIIKANLLKLIKKHRLNDKASMSDKGKEEEG